jgi:hypothetical protein
MAVTFIQGRSFVDALPPAPAVFAVDGYTPVAGDLIVTIAQYSNAVLAGTGFNVANGRQLTLLTSVTSGLFQYRVHYGLIEATDTGIEFGWTTTGSTFGSFAYAIFRGADQTAPVVLHEPLSTFTSASEIVSEQVSAFTDSYRVVAVAGFLNSPPAGSLNWSSTLGVIVNATGETRAGANSFFGAPVTVAELPAGTITASATPQIWAFADFLISSGEPIVAPPPDPGTPGGPVLGQAGDRLRSSISETTGSLLEAVDVRAVDASVSEAYTWAQELAPAQPVVFRELFRERDSADADFVYLPRPRQNLVMENQYEGVTVLSRLASYYPARVFDTVDSTGLGITTSGGATAQQVLEFLLNCWALDTGWLAYEPVPDLRLRLPGFAPSDYWAPRFGTVRTPVLAFPQDRARRRSALEILQALLSPFPGTVLRQNSAGRLEIVPTYGPDADETPTITLEPIDLYSVTIGKPDPFSVFNRATFASQGYERAEDVELMQPAWFQVGSNIQFGRSNWFSPPNDRLNLQPPPEGFDTVQESYTAGEDYALNRPNLWPISNERIPAGDGISLVDSVGDPLVTMAWARYFNDSLVDSGTDGLTIVTPVIPFSGAWVTAFSVNIPLPADDAWATIRARWNDARQGVEFGLADPTKLETNCFTGCNGVIIEFTLNDASTGYIETGTTTGLFGFVDEGDSLPAVGGGNAVLDSQTEFGVLEASVTIEGYSLDAGTLVEVARAFVLENITPKVVRELDLSTIGVRLGFDSIGRLVELPNTEQGRVIGRTYADDFVARSWRATAEVEVPNALGPGAVDVTTDWLLMDDLTFWTDDDGSFSEVF